MAEISNTELNEIIQRVTAEVQRETRSEEAKGFVVADLQEQLRDIVKTAGGGADRAWKVGGTYDTSGSPRIESVWKVSGSYSTLAGPNLARAWKVELGYDTSSGTIEHK